MYFGGEEEKNILNYVDFLRLCNVINQFTGFSIDILQMVLVFLFLEVQGTFNGGKCSCWFG